MAPVKPATKSDRKDDLLTSGHQTRKGNTRNIHAGCPIIMLILCSSIRKTFDAQWQLLDSSAVDTGSQP